MTSITRIVVLTGLLAALSGCGGVKPVVGGTQGELRVAGALLSDVQVTVHQVDGNSTRPVGFAVTDIDGAFELVTNGARGALWLSPGEYRITLESAGAPVQFSQEFARAETTPLKVSWAADDTDLEIEVASQ
ncbi:MAG: hypothetical protein HY290_32780 [Planctomycetia bacterium]|nr:hypothetical protein [Planctomycetia bacterium]